MLQDCFGGAGVVTLLKTPLTAAPIEFQLLSAVLEQERLMLRSNVFFPLVDVTERDYEFF